MSAPSVPEQVNYLLHAIQQSIPYWQEQCLTTDEVIDRIKTKDTEVDVEFEILIRAIINNQDN